MSPGRPELGAAYIWTKVERLFYTDWIETAGPTYCSDLNDLVEMLPLDKGVVPKRVCWFLMTESMIYKLIFIYCSINDYNFDILVYKRFVLEWMV